MTAFAKLLVLASIFCGAFYLVLDQAQTPLDQYEATLKASAGEQSSPSSASSVRSSVACIDPAGRVTWSKTGGCPSGTRQVPNACDSGCCQPCPPEGCPPETVEALMCCPPICGEGSECFPIVATTAECPPGSVLYECDHGITLPDGSSDCYDTPPGS